MNLDADRKLYDLKRQLPSLIKKAERGDSSARKRIVAIRSEISELRQAGATEGQEAFEHRAVAAKRAGCKRWHDINCACGDAE